MNVLLTEQAMDAQIAALGSMLIDPESVGPMLHQLTADDFTIGHYRHIFQAIKRLHGQGKSPDALTVNDALGGNYRDLLGQIIEVTPTSANAGEYAAICRRTALQIHLAEFGEQLANAADLDTAQAVIDRINALGCEKPGVRITSLRQCYEEFLDRHAEGKKPPYLTWGIPALDDLVYVEPGDFIVLGGYASAGKTALALQIMFHIARGKRVGYFYYENNDRKLFDRLVTFKSKVSFRKIKRFDLQEEDFEQIVAVQEALTTPNFNFVRASGMTVADIRSIALSQHYDVVAVDYLQKIPVSRERRNLNDFERVTEASSGLQDLGQQTGVTVFALSQLSRPEKAKGKAAFPGMHSFRQSGQIEQDADVALLLFREDEDNPKNMTRTLKIGKNKEGEANKALSMYFDGDTQTFSRIFPKVPPKEKPKPEPPPFRQEIIELPGRSDGLPF